MGGLAFSTTTMDNPDEFTPRLTDPSLLFTSEDFVVIEDLKRGLRRYLGRWLPPPAALFWVQALNWNYLASKSRSARVILATADGSQLAECIIVDIYARLLQNKSGIRTSRTTYYVVLEGFADHQKVNFLSMHYFWLSSAFQSTDDQQGQRFLLN